MNDIGLVERPVRRLSILDFDLENRPLSYLGMDWTSAEVTAIGWSWVGDDEVSTMMLHLDGRYGFKPGTLPEVALDPADAFRVFRHVLTSADILTGHYITKHDLPIVNSMLMELGLEPLPELLTQDTQAHSIRVKDLSRSQENLASMFRMAEAKHHMTQSEWREANRLTEAGIEGSRKRVVDDVIQHKALREEMLKRKLLGSPKKWRSRK